MAEFAARRKTVSLVYRYRPSEADHLRFLFNMASTDAVLTQILSQLQVLQVAQQTMQAKVRSTFTFTLIYSAPFWYQLDVLSTQGKPPLEPKAVLPPTSPPRSAYPQSSPPSQPSLASSTPSSVPKQDLLSDKEREKLLYPGRVNLTSQLISFTVDLSEPFAVLQLIQTNMVLHHIPSTGEPPTLQSVVQSFVPVFLLPSNIAMPLAHIQVLTPSIAHFLSLWVHLHPVINPTTVLLHPQSIFRRTRPGQIQPRSFRSTLGVM